MVYARDFIFILCRKNGGESVSDGQGDSAVVMLSLDPSSQKEVVFV